MGAGHIYNNRDDTPYGSQRYLTVIADHYLTRLRFSKPRVNKMKLQTWPALLGSLLLTGSLLPAAEPLWVKLGEKNQGQGLTVPSGGDGANVPAVIGGSPCRLISGAQSHYLYVKADSALVPPGDYDAYAVIEYFDGRPQIARVQYDASPFIRELNSFYAAADDVVLLGGAGEWQRAVVHLPHTRFGHGQNFSADFRLAGDSLAVRRIEIRFTQPPGYRQGGFDPAELEKLRTRIGPGMDLDLGCDAKPAEAALYKMLGFNCVESYVLWQTVEDAGEGQWDWSRWDRQVEVLKQAGLKWAPLIVCGPAYSLPKWFRESDRSVPYICLEHGGKSKIQSLWDPNFRFWVERFIKAFADRYRDSGMLQLVRLGVSGIYGETLYPSGPSDGWTFHNTGLFHNHAGWWAGDPLAVKSFREHMRLRYGEIGALNRAWGAAYGTFEEVTTRLPSQAPSRRARLDFVNWYLDCMTDYSAFWGATVRKYFPTTPIYQSLGGAGAPVLGADFSAQAKAAAPQHVRVRVTNEGSDYAANFSVTREVISAARAFGLDYGLEPAGPVSAEGNIARIYNAMASGASHLFCYSGNILQDQSSLEKFRHYAPYLRRCSPEIYAALYLPKTSWELDDQSIHRVLEAARLLRGHLDFELLDRTTFQTPLAERIKVIAIPEAPYAEPAEIETLQHWVEAGGILIARPNAEGLLLRTPEGSDEQRAALLATPPASLRLVKPVVREAAPRRFALSIGAAHDADYLFGNWYGVEPGGMVSKDPRAHMRWTAAKAGCFLPCNPNGEATLILTANLPSQSLVGANRVLVNGALVGVLDKSGLRIWRFRVSRGILARRSIAEVTFEIQTVLPTDKPDSRSLGMAVGEIELCSRGAENEPPAATPLACEMDWSQAELCLRRIGHGATLIVPGLGTREFNVVVTEAVIHPERLIPGSKGVELPLVATEGVFATKLHDSVLYYNSTAEPQKVRGVEVPAGGILELKCEPNGGGGQ